MLKTRKFRIVIVGRKHGVGVQPEARADGQVDYDGRYVEVKI